MTRNILIIGPAWVGDMVMAQTLFKLLKQQSDHQIDVLAPAWTFPLLNRMEEVRQAIEMPIAHGQIQLKKRYQLAKQCRHHYDQAIVLPNSFKSALIPWFAKIKQRTGWLGELRYGLLNDIRYLNKKKYPLMIERFLALGLPKEASLEKPYPNPCLQINESKRQEILTKLQLSVKAQQPILALSPGAAFGHAKKWPVNYFAAVAQEKIKQGWQVWLFGAGQDQRDAQEIINLLPVPCVNLVDRVSLDETIDLLSVTSGLVTNDSGLMHVAAALGKPLIAIYGPTSPAFTPPLSNQAIILQLNLTCQPCFQRTCPLKHHQCMRDILPQQVLSAIESWGIS